MLKKIAETISKAGTIAILPHITADGDALGSSFALAIALADAQKDVSVLLEETVPQSYVFLPGLELSHVYSDEEREYDMVLALDCGDIDRLGSRRKVFEKAAITVNIDHHPTNQGFAVYDHIDASSSATGELIYRLLQLIGTGIGKAVSICLYTAIASDTGGFRYSNTTSETHIICSELLKQGIDVADISKRVFDTTSLEKVRLIGEAIDSLVLYENGRLAVMTITSEAIRRSGAGEEDSDGVINTARNIRGVEVAAMIRELDNGEIKVNLRSNDDVDVSAIADKHSGGGHKKAAGFTARGSGLEEVKNMLIDDIRGAL